jgi:hypothetical protein
MIIIKCAKCKTKIFKYIKIGKGKLLCCLKDRIIEDYSIHDGKNIKCKCGNIIGFDKEKSIKLKQDSFTYSGTKNY